MALADVIKDALFLRHVWRFMLPAVGMPCIPIFEENDGAVQLSQKSIINPNSKHMDARHHFLRDLVGRTQVSIIHVPSQYQHADSLQSNSPGLF